MSSTVEAASDDPERVRVQTWAACSHADRKLIQEGLVLAARGLVRLAQQLRMNNDHEADGA